MTKTVVITVLGYHELTIAFYGSHLVIPKFGRQLLLEEQHEAHLGIFLIKSRAFMLMWWPNIDKDLFVKKVECLE